MLGRAVTFAGILFVALAGRVTAQTAPTKEFGIDFAITSIDPDAGDRVLQIGAPVDIRIGFLGSGNSSFETRFGLSYTDYGNQSLLRFTPSLHLMFSKGGQRPYLGPYLTLGALADVVRVSSSSDSDMRTQFGVTVGVGDRNELGQNDAFRPEFFITKKFERGSESLVSSDYVPGSLAFGVRFGLSFFR